MTERDDLRQSREHKLEALANLGLPYLPSRYGPTRSAEEIRHDFGVLEGSTVCIAGRLMTVRLMGKAAFAHLQDASGRIQIYFKLDVLGPTKYEYFKQLDIGDIVGVEGSVFKTRTGEVTIEVVDCVLLAKSFLPLPDKWHGLVDVETRYRRRYLDLISSEETRRTLRLRSATVHAIRRFLDDRGFAEVETPILQPIYGGAAANPFVTRYESLDADVYLRIATELYLKQLIVGGMERVYEIGKDFRNEGFSRKHSPEFTMVELYQAYADYTDIMSLTEEMVSTAARHVLGTSTTTFDGHAIDLSPPWKRLTVYQAIQEYTGVALTPDASRDEVLGAVARLGLPLDPQISRGRAVEEIVSNCVEPHLMQPTILYDFPEDFPGSLLARRKPGSANLGERFEVYMGGMELGNAFTENNDPVDQRRRMEEAAALRGDEHQEIDRNFLLSLEYAMPPTGGLGIGIDRIVMILAGARHIRETIPFPLLRATEEAHAEP